ncbi:MAG: hypothetical protein JSW60_03955 [Thermoplasmatales archaeon]|nr:MAG: hypothetical protein JSW60_03955 [Thermoplasmatales archaeon]
MAGKKAGIIVLYIIGLLMGIIAVAMSFTGLPEGYDTEPILGFGLFLVAIAGIALAKD